MDLLQLAFPPNWVNSDVYRVRRNGASVAWRWQRRWLYMLVCGACCGSFPRQSRSFSVLHFTTVISSPVDRVQDVARASIAGAASAMLRPSGAL